jgi:hypothetical protein
MEWPIYPRKNTPNNHKSSLFQHFLTSFLIRKEGVSTIEAKLGGIAYQSSGKVSDVFNLNAFLALLTLIPN